MEEGVLLEDAALGADVAGGEADDAVRPSDRASALLFASALLYKFFAGLGRPWFEGGQFIETNVLTAHIDVELGGVDQTG